MDNLATIETASAGVARATGNTLIPQAAAEAFEAHIDYCNAFDGSAEEADAKARLVAAIAGMNDHQRNLTVTALRGLARYLEQAG